MNNTAIRALLRHGIARSPAGRAHDVARAGLAAATTTPTSQRCQRSLLSSSAVAPSLGRLHGTRAFHASAPVHKKRKEEEDDDKRSRGRGKAAQKPTKKGSSNSGEKSGSSGGGSGGGGGADEGSKHPQPSPEEPLDFADVESRLQRHEGHFQAALKKLQTGGRFDPDALGALRVTVDRRAEEAYPLRELAQVVPRGGRAVSLLVHEAAYVKPIMSAVQASPEYNQQPQRDPDNELELVLRVEPEKVDELVRRIRAVTHEWRERVRTVRQKRDKLHATWKKDGLLGPDLKRTADKELDKVIKSAIAVIDDAEKSAIKSAESK
ncbi:ribosome recycling factor [Xylaria palmicola]|nr:ribosome recycling factor [Xylaria palmicola]